MKRNISAAHRLRYCHPERKESAAKQAIRRVKGFVLPSSILRKRVRRSFAITLDALREIFDESAYSRFLARHRLAPSCESYAAFCNENSQARANRARCC